MVEIQGSWLFAFRGFHRLAGRIAQKAFNLRDGIERAARRARRTQQAALRQARNGYRMNADGLRGLFTGQRQFRYVAVFN